MSNESPGTFAPFGRLAGTQSRRSTQATSPMRGRMTVHPVRNDLARPIVLAYPQPPLTICTDRPT
ncbi:hypothetical protein ABZ297_18960 [Nonomuraea sp. NPDC005983]|uniref:hypothetical protein n=1 Tax=Nonomuraea sp. NPDC005983 TaxID=3155595 RepID=UPI0033A4F2B1